MSRKCERLAVQWFQALGSQFVLEDVSFKGAGSFLDLPMILGKCRILQRGKILQIAWMGNLENREFCGGKKLRLGCPLLEQNRCANAGIGKESNSVHVVASSL